MVFARVTGVLERLTIVAIVVLAAGCLSDPATPCGPGFCAEGKVCDAIHNGCVTEEQVSSCEGQAAKAPCTTPGIADGACFDGVCFPVGCGNGFVESELGEVCDDGNNLFGDGCSADCVSDETCGNNVIDDAQGEACDDGNNENEDGCQANCVLPTCGDGFTDAFENCDDGDANSDDANGACRTNCQPQRCGDGIEDSGEQCDDGNLEVNDGCTPDCSSDETCGNGVTDFHRGEFCDDASELLSHDGCGNLCLPESPDWSERAVGSPVSRSVAYDAARARLVLFDNTARTWEFDGQSWLEVTPTTGNPPARSNHAMAYDAARKQVVLFGGSSFADTWVWDGQSWTEVTPTPGDPNPPGRNQHAMVYDPVRDRVVLFGGGFVSGSPLPTTTLLDDTWVWDGSAWTEMEVAGPPARLGHKMIFDSARGEVVLFAGGRGRSILTPIGSFADTWTWDGVSWTDTGITGPPPREDHVMVYDATAGRAVVFGGDDVRIDSSGSFPVIVTTPRADTWAWNGAAWNEVIPTGASPDSRNDSGAGFDLVAQRLVLFGIDTWTLEGDTWTPLALDVAIPSARQDAAIAYDRARGRLVLFGGTDNADRSDETWEWDGHGWRLAAASGQVPTARSDHAMAYDEARGTVVLFGGEDGSGVLNDTRSWDGSTWTLATPADTPPPMAGHAMAYDAERQRVVLFGNGQTWEWDGATWHQMTPDDIPAALKDHAMAYDPVRRRVVLFGGSFTNRRDPVLLDETWVWDGANWTRVFEGLTPPARVDHQLAYDANRRTVVMFGPGDTFEWDGVGWRELVLASPARSRHAMAYDAARGQVIATGGRSGATPLDDTWRFRFERSGDPGESCELGAIDYDGDGAVGCDDHDCWGRCLPHCPPDSTPDWPNDCDDALPHCGDGVCNPDLETQRLCPGDCGPAPAICGDFICEGAEDTATCPGDCQP